MASTNRRKNRRAALFSLSARIHRRESAPSLPRFGDHYEDDDCPVCVAARTGGDVLAAMREAGDFYTVDADGDLYRESDGERVLIRRRRQ